MPIAWKYFKYYIMLGKVLILVGFLRIFLRGVVGGPIHDQLTDFLSTQRSGVYDVEASMHATYFLEEMGDISQPVLALAEAPSLCYEELGCYRDTNLTARKMGDWDNLQTFALVGGVYAVTGYVAFGPKNVRNFVIRYTDSAGHAPDVSMDLRHGNDRYLGTLYAIYRIGVESAFIGMTGSLAGIAVYKLGEGANAVFSGVLSIFQGASPPSKPSSQVVSPHDELRKRSRFGCTPAWIQHQWKSTYAPVDWDIKLTCRKYRTNNRDEELIQAARVAMYKLISSNSDVTTFTIYNPSNLEAHARCSMEFEHFSDNTSECPYDLPGDKDGAWCVGCTKSPHQVNWNIY